MPDTDKKTPLSFEEVQGVSDNDRDFVEYVDSILASKGNTISNISIKEKSQSLYVPDSLRNELIQKFESRNSMLHNYLKTSLEIPEKNMAIRTADKDTLQIYKQNAKYKIGMSLPGAN